MNKIFKVIWSKSKQCYVVVSEMAKNTTGKKKIVVAGILATLMAGQAVQVDAVPIKNNSTKTGIFLFGVVRVVVLMVISKMLLLLVKTLQYLTVVVLPLVTLQ